MNKIMAHYRILGILSLALIVLVGAGCAGSRPPAVEDMASTSNYIIGPSDGLMIYVRDNDDLSMQVPVRPDGKISIPLVQDIQAAGKSPAQLADDLQDALSQYVRNPLVTVVVTSSQGAYDSQIRVVGQATEPKAIAYANGMTLLDAMIQVGGLTQFAAGNRAKLVRTVDGKKHTYSVDIQSLLNGDIDQNVPLAPGDVIIIPRSLL